MGHKNELLTEAAKRMGSKGGTHRARNLSKRELSEIGHLGGTASALAKKKRKKTTKETKRNGNR